MTSCSSSSKSSRSLHCDTAVYLINPIMKKTFSIIIHILVVLIGIGLIILGLIKSKQWSLNAVIICVFFGVLISLSTFLFRKLISYKQQKAEAEAVVMDMENAVQYNSQHNKPLNIYDIDKMSGVQFENFCGYVLAKQGYSVKYTKASNDQGVDIIAEGHRHRVAIQCKRYSKPLGNGPIQEVHAGAHYYKCDKAAVFTNNYFTKGAKDLARKTGVNLFDRNKLILLINKQIKL